MKRETWDNAGHHDQEVNDMPDLPDVWLRSIQVEPHGNYFYNHFHGENGSRNVFEELQIHGLEAFWVVQGVL